jgi:lysophospholipase L1-like esterase
MALSGWRKLLTITLPVMVVAALVAAAGLEVWVRAVWEPRKGNPGFFLTDARRGQRLAANYSGWFAGVPVHINSLELRDPREYDVAKGPSTFRILVLGDSVTFGHGSVYEHTYPYLLEQRLKAWRPDIDWQVWNAAVPGYNTSQELAHLEEVAPRFHPDLVIVGFFENDLIDNRRVTPPRLKDVAVARALTLARRHVYSLELYKKVFLQLAWKLSASDDYRRRLEHLGTEESLLANVADASTLQQQALTPFERLTDTQVRDVNCVYGMKPNAALIPAMQADSGFSAWTEAVRGFQRVGAARNPPVMFFLNDVPPICPDGDVFYDGGSKAIDDFYLRIMGNGTPAVSVFDEFLHMRPSQMPNARAHAIGNSNVVKADVLFEFLKANPLLIDRMAPARSGNP